MNIEFLPIMMADAASKAAAGVLGAGAVWLILLMIAALFWFWALIDALTNTALDNTERLMWAVIIFLLPFLGALAYFFIGRHPNGGTPVHR
jgi:hypothetical protein